MNSVALKPETGCAYDLVALGEVMLRLDPGNSRIRTARNFDVWEGGGEYNVARGLSRTFRRRTAILTSLVDNEVGQLIESLVMAGGVDPAWIHWREFDGTGSAVRNALNFTERGFGVRGALGVSDRGHSAASQISAEDIDIDGLFASEGVRWLHTGGIFAGLSVGTLECARLVMDRARESGTVISVDLNFRPSLFAGPDGEARAKETFESLVARADIVIGGPADFEQRLGVQPGSEDTEDTQRFVDAAKELMARYPHLKVVASTIRQVDSASIHHWGARAYTREGEWAESRTYEDLAIMDRVGGGDGFVAGFAHAFMEGFNLQTALDYGAAHGALAMTTPGDNSMASLGEVRQLAQHRTSGERR